MAALEEADVEDKTLSPKEIKALKKDGGSAETQHIVDFGKAIRKHQDLNVV